MNRNNYEIKTGDIILDEKAEHIMNNLCFLANERNYYYHFPEFSTIEFNGVDEEELIMHIEDLEKVYNKAGTLNHKAYLYLMDVDNVNGGFKIYHNDTIYGTDINNSAPVAGGEDPLSALRNAWDKWSIPPVLILNANFYMPGVTISEVVE